MATFQITARSLIVSIRFTATLPSSGEAAERAAERTARLFGDQPFGITVTKLREAEHG